MTFKREIVWDPPTTRRRVMMSGCLVAAGLTLTAGLAASRPATESVTELANRDASTQVMRLAFERFPQWRATHSAAGCPDRIDQLAGPAQALDPWGHAFRYTCDPLLLQTRSPGIAITSAGEDGRFGTSDDIGADWRRGVER